MGVGVRGWVYEEGSSCTLGKEWEYGEGRGGNRERGGCRSESTGEE